MISVRVQTNIHQGGPLAMKQSVPVWSPDCNGSIHVQPTQESVTRDAGVLLLRQALDTRGVIEALFRQLQDQHNPLYVQHSCRSCPWAARFAPRRTCTAHGPSSRHGSCRCTAQPRRSLLSHGLADDFERRAILGTALLMQPVTEHKWRHLHRDKPRRPVTWRYRQAADVQAFFPQQQIGQGEPLLHGILA